MKQLKIGIWIVIAVVIAYEWQTKKFLDQARRQREELTRVNYSISTCYSDLAKFKAKFAVVPIQIAAPPSWFTSHGALRRMIDEQTVQKMEAEKSEKKCYDELQAAKKGKL
jgi:hypothetical protein